MNILVVAFTVCFLISIVTESIPVIEKHELHEKISRPELVDEINVSIDYFDL